MATNQSAGSPSGDRNQADDEVAAYLRRAAFRNQMMARATEIMFDQAGVGPGGRVLDVGAGNGEQTILAAQRVGPTGSVLATDISPAMLAQAEEAARRVGLANVSCQPLRAEELDVLAADSFDAAYGRQALQFVEDLPRALRAIRRALKPGRKFAGLVWADATRNPFFGVLARFLAERDYPLAKSLFQMGGLGAPGRLAEAMREAGFRDVTDHIEPAVRHYLSLDVALDIDNWPPGRQIQDQVTASDLAAARAEIERAYQPFAGPNGVDLPAEFVIVAGTK